MARALHEYVNFVHDPEKQYSSLSEWSPTGVTDSSPDKHEQGKRACCNRTARLHTTLKRLNDRLRRTGACGYNRICAHQIGM